jgi:hypothetical protein
MWAFSEYLRVSQHLTVLDNRPLTAMMTARGARRMNRIAICAFIVAASALAACQDNPVGRICILGARDAGEDNLSIVASPALDCQSLTCLHWVGHTPDLCTGSCDTASDCDKDSQSPCRGGFECVVPVYVGPFCCKKMCVCKDYLPADGGGLVVSEACNAANPVNECCNLEGRREHPEIYPKCSNE